MRSRQPKLFRTVMGTLWTHNRARTAALVASWIVLALGQPLLALALRGLAGTPDGGAVSWAVVAATASAALGQALFQSYLLRIEILDRAGQGLAEALFAAVAKRPGIGHLEDAGTLTRIRTALNCYAVVSLYTGGIQLLAVTAGLLLTIPTLGRGLQPALFLLPFCLPLVLFAARSFRIRVAAADEAAGSERAAATILSTLFDVDAQPELRISGAASALKGVYERHLRRARRILLQGHLKATLLMAFAWLIFIAGFMFVLYTTISGSESGLLPGFFSYEEKRPVTTASDVVPAIVVALQLQGLAVVMVNGSAEFVRGRRVISAYKEVFHVGEEEGPVGTEAPPSMIVDGIQLEQVRFSYPGGDRVVLDDVSVKLPAGSVVAILGVHGSGKSTLVKLLTRMYEPTSGRITVDGRPLSTLDPGRWRQRTTACFQDFIRVPVTIREAVGIGDLPAPADSRIHYALGRAGATELVDSFEDGLSTQLGDAGYGLQPSGGQWQRLAVARAFMRASPLLVILDEPSASFDPIAERKVFESTVDHVRSLAAEHGTISILIAHRYATVQDADLIVVLEHGRLIEQGTHEDLLQLGGRYADLYRRQRAAYA